MASAGFFDRQFRKQIEQRDYALNPFERAILPHLAGEVLDLGCGLGNLSLAAARAGCSVTALDASAAAVTDLARRARDSGVTLHAEAADLSRYASARQFDAVVSIGLLMFFGCQDALRVLDEIRRSVRPGGIAAVNVLIAGTTYMAMFDAAAHCLFEREALTAAFAGWMILLSRYEDFPAPEQTTKRFHTVIARCPA